MPRRFLLPLLMAAGLLVPALSPLLALLAPAACPMPCCAGRGMRACCRRQAAPGARLEPLAPCARLTQPVPAPPAPAFGLPETAAARARLAITPARPAPERAGVRLAWIGGLAAPRPPPAAA